MATQPDVGKVAAEIRQELLASGRESRRMRSHNFWSTFGVQRRTPASIERVEAALTALGLSIRSPGDVLGTEGHDDWIVISRAMHEAPIPNDPLEPPGKVSLTTGSPHAAATAPAWSAPAGSGATAPIGPRAEPPIPSAQAAATSTASRTQVSTTSGLDRLLGFAKRHPWVSLLLVLFFFARPWPFLFLGAMAWLWRLYRQGRLRPVTRFAGRHKIGTLLTGSLAMVSALGLVALSGSPPRETRSLPAAVPMTTKSDRDTATPRPEATATEQATETAIPPTETETATPMPPTATPRPPTPMPPTAPPPVASDGGQPAAAPPPAPVQQFIAPQASDRPCDTTLKCHDFNDWETMHAWWDRCGQPAKYDRDHDGTPCEDLP